MLGVPDSIREGGFVGSGADDGRLRVGLGVELDPEIPHFPPRQIRVGPGAALAGAARVAGEEGDEDGDEGGEEEKPEHALRYRRGGTAPAATNRGATRRSGARR